MLRVTETVEPNLYFSAEIHSAPPHPPFPLITRPNREKESPHSTKPTSPGSFSFPFEKFGAKPRGETRLFSGPRYVGARIARKLSRSGTRLD